MDENKALTDKQEQFCLEYLTDLNATQAAIRAGYSENTANEQGSRMLAKVNVQRRIAELQAERAERLQIQHELSLKGIDKGLFLRIWEAQEEDLEEQALREQVEKRIRSKGPINTENHPKFYAYFARKGYSSSMICRLLKEYQTAEEIS